MVKYPMTKAENPRKEGEPLHGESIVFDWGNTLVHDPFDKLLTPVSEEAVVIAKSKFGYPLNQELFATSWSQSNSTLNFEFASHFFQEEPWIQAGLKGAGVPDEIRALLAPEILANYRRQFKQMLENDPRREELRTTLEELRNRGKHLAVVSNDRSFTPGSTLSWLGIRDLFDHLLTSDEVGIEKPNPEIFAKASELFGRPISDIIYVGDDPVRDVYGAHQAGIQAILYIPPQEYRSSKSWRDYSVSPDKPDATVEKFSDLLKVIA